MRELEKYHHKTFEDIRQQAEGGHEYWSARDLQKVLGYAQWRKFEMVIEKAQIACSTSKQDPQYHFAQVGKMVDLGSGAVREVLDYRLSRYACYLIVQNGDSSKPVIAAGQTYFAIQTRRQELADDKSFQQLDEDEKRIFLRNELREQNRELGKVAGEVGVKTGLDFAIFQNHGYKGLYAGLDAKDIHAKKGLKKSQHILDHMGSTELAANLFRATQTEEKLKRDEVKGKEKANRTHYEVGKEVRKAIKNVGGTMPEELPATKTSVKALEKQIGKKGEDTEC